ncbi:hypothetical protein ACFL4T_09290 [candidate division KSB1 bacterium]
MGSLITLLITLVFIYVAFKVGEFVLKTLTGIAVILLFLYLVWVIC